MMTLKEAVEIKAKLEKERKEIETETEKIQKEIRKKKEIVLEEIRQYILNVFRQLGYPQCRISFLRANDTYFVLSCDHDTQRITIDQIKTKFIEIDLFGWSLQSDISILDDSLHNYEIMNRNQNVTNTIIKNWPEIKESLIANIIESYRSELLQSDQRLADLRKEYANIAKFQV